MNSGLAIQNFWSPNKKLSDQLCYKMCLIFEVLCFSSAVLEQPVLYSLLISNKYPLYQRRNIQENLFK